LWTVNLSPGLEAVKLIEEFDEGAVAHASPNFLSGELQSSGVYSLEDLVYAAIVFLRVILLEISDMNGGLLNPALIQIV
jgi:hypothetical protein